MIRFHTSRLFAVSITTAFLATACGSADDFDDQAIESDDVQRTSVSTKVPRPKLLSTPRRPPIRPVVLNTGPGNDKVYIRKASGQLGVSGWFEVEINGQISNATKNNLESTLYLLGEGNDTLIVDADVEADIHAYGDSGNDYMVGGAGDDYFDGRSGNDTIYGRQGSDYIQGNIGNDELHGGKGSDVVLGSVGEDRIWGDRGHDFLDGSVDDDVIFGGPGNDYIQGSLGDDALYGETGNDTIHGHYDDDTINGGSGHDMIFGGLNNDTIDGGPGNDEIYGGMFVPETYVNYTDSPGQDILFGGSGTDAVSSGHYYEGN